MEDNSAARQIDSERDIDASRVEVTCSECGAHKVVPRETVKAVIECGNCRTFLAADPRRVPLVVPDEDGAKGRTQDFWDANPCGLAATWEETRDVRFSITDPYLTRYLTEDRLSTTAQSRLRPSA
ncbi:MAG: hypothetical protein IH987_18915 [Planctomycetes bacterium]|nr:hypothetical protein [Planctomycetota bacterium]